MSAETVIGRQVVIRLAEVADLPLLARLQRAAASELSVGYTDEQIAAFLAEHGATDARLVEDGTYYVAVVGEKVLASGGWSFRKELIGGGHDDDSSDRLDPATAAARLRGFFVDPAYAGRGLARRLLRHSEAAARAAGYRRGLLQATPAGRPLYESEGYRLIETQQVETPGVAPLISFLMEKCFASDVPGSGPSDDSADGRATPAACRARFRARPSTQPRARLRHRSKSSCPH